LNIGPELAAVRGNDSDAALRDQSGQANDLPDDSGLVMPLIRLNGCARWDQASCEQSNTKDEFPRDIFHGQ